MYDTECPHCGSVLPENARRCRTCGADADCGWGEAESDGFEDEFDYDEFVRREFPESAGSSDGRFWVKLVLTLVVISLLLSLFW